MGAQYQPGKEAELQKNAQVLPGQNPELSNEQFFRKEQEKMLQDKLWRISPYIHFDDNKSMEMEAMEISGNPPAKKERKSEL